MAYNTNEERLKVRGSEQITRDLKVNRDAFIARLEAGKIEDKGDLNVEGEIIAGDDVTISGDLYVNGTEYITNTETAQTTDNYLVLRHNQTGALANGEHSGVAVHNYAVGKTATITADKDGTWRVADNTETDTNYTNISYYNGTYYTGLTRTATTVISGMKTAFDEDELDESVYYTNSYYHFDGNQWFPVSLSSNRLTLGSAVTSTATINALNALTKHDLVYFRTLTVTTINEVENQPLLTRAETSNLTGGQALTWDATNQKAVGKTIDTTVTSNSSNLITSGAVKSAIDNVDVNAKCLDNATGTLAIAHGGTGQTTAQAIVDKTIQAGIGDASADVADTTSIITTNQAGYSATNERLYRRPATALWNYIKGKISSVLGLTATDYSGKAATAGTADQADKGKNGSDYCAFGSNAFNSTAFTTCKGTVTISDRASINVNTPVALCTGTTTVGKSKSCELDFNTCTGVLTATCFCGTASCAVSSTCADKGKNGSFYEAFGSNAFNSVAFTTCVGTVTVSSPASSCNYAFPIALCTGATSVGNVGSSGLTYNPGTQTLTVSKISGVCSGTTRTFNLDNRSTGTACTTLNNCGSTRATTCIISYSPKEGCMVICSSGGTTGKMSLCATAPYTTALCSSIEMYTGSGRVFCIDGSGQLHLKSGKTICYDL